MEATSNKSSLLLSKYFQIIHLCLSIAVVIAMVHNQLVNDDRFKKLEQEVYHQQNFNTVEEIVPEKKNLESPHKVIKRNVPMGINKDSKNESTSNSRKEKVIDNSERDVVACLDVLRTFANRSRTNVELNICKQFRGLPGQPGTRGPRGKRGKQGKKGLQGQKGKIGKEGSMGKHGPPGPRGEKGFSGNVTMIGLKGDTGAKGNNGEKGSKGEAGGQKGDPVDRGEKGSIGQRGCPGESFAAPRFYAGRKHLIFIEGETATLFCKARAKLYSHITWYRYSVTLATNGRYDVDQNITVLSASLSERTQCDLKTYFVTQSSLVISQLRGNDSGSYYCEARNMMGVSTYEIRLHIHGSKTCSSNEYRCKGNEQQCIQSDYKCDGDIDCPLGDDEEDCPSVSPKPACSANMFTCTDKSCIRSSWRCDDEVDCPDASDESNCRSNTCSSNEYRCKGNEQNCILSSFKCDGDRDCPLGDDEEDCPSVSPKPAAGCSANMFTCKDKSCILSAWRCDDEDDCPDGSDENNCPKRP